MPAPDRDAEFKMFYDSEGRRVRELAMFLVGDRDLAADLAQETFLRAYRAWGRIHNRDPGPYVRRTLVNLCKNVYRKRSTERKQWAPPPSGLPSQAPNVHEAMRVMTALRELPPLRRAAVVLRYYEDMSDHQIAVLLNRPLGTVKSDIRRSLKQLKPLLEETAEELR